MSFLHRPWVLVALLAWAASGWAPLQAQDEAKLRVAHEAYKRGEHALAVEDYRAYLVGNPTGAPAIEARYFLGESLLALKKEGEAIPLFVAVADALKVGDSLHRAALYRAATLTRNQNGKAAEPLLKRFAEGYPKDELTPELEFSLAEAARADGRVPEARGLYERVMQSGSAEADDAALALGVVDYQRGEYAAALVTFRAFPQKFGTSPLLLSARLNEGLSLYQLGQYEGAAAVLRDVAAQSAKPESADLEVRANYYLALSLSMLGQDGPAADLLLAQLAKQPKHPLAEGMQLQAGVALAKTERLDQAVGQFQKFLNDYPTSSERPRAFYEQAAVAARLKRPDLIFTAWQQLDRFFPATPWHERTAVLAGEAALAYPNQVGAPSLNELINRTQDAKIKLRLEYLAALASFQKRDYADAQTRLLRVLNSNPPDAVRIDAQLLVGRALLEQGQGAAAVEPLLQYVQKGGDPALRADAVRGLGRIVAAGQAGDKLTSAQLADLANAQPTAPSLLLSLGDALYDADKRADANLCYDRVIKHTGSSLGDKVAARLGLAWGYYKDEKLAEAKEQFKTVAELPPVEIDAELHAEAVYMRGVTAEELGQAAEAQAAYETLIGKFAQSSYVNDSMIRLGRMLTAGGAFESANKLYEVLLKRVAGTPEAGTVLFDHAKLAEKEGKADLAKQRYAALLQQAANAPEAAEALLQLAELAYAAGDFAQSGTWLAQMEKAGVPEPLRPAYLLRRGMAAYKQGEKEAAQRLLTELATNHTATTHAAVSIFWLGELALDKADAARAAALYRELLKRDDAASYHAVGQLRLAQAELDSKRFDEAFAEAEKVLAPAGKPADPALRLEALYVQGRARQQKARFAEARTAYEKLVADTALGGNTELHAKARFMIGETYLFERNYDAAKKAFLETVALYAYPEWQSMALLELGKAYEGLNDPGRAKATYNEVLQRFGQQAAADQAKQRLAALK